MKQLAWRQPLPGYLKPPYAPSAAVVGALCYCNYDDDNTRSVGCAVTLGCLIEHGTNECFHQRALQEPQDTHISILM